MKRLIIDAIIIALATAVLWWITPRRTTTKTTTITRIDTVLSARPQPRDSVLVRVETVRLKGHTILRQNYIQDSGKIIYDTIAIRDSVEVSLPITQRTYTDDSTYTAWVSGYHPKLDSLRTYRRTVTVTHAETQHAKRSRWGIGVQAGYGLTPKGPQPYLGIGLNFNFTNW